MLLSALELQRFRNYPKKTFSFRQEVTVFLGPNAVGKTNILEAIFLLSTGKSFRADRDTEMISWDEEMARVKATLPDVKLEIMLTTGTVAGIPAPIKKFMVNGVSKRVVDFIGTARSVLFWPEDLELIISSPTLRRRYLDFVLTQTDWEYRRSLLSYEKGIRQRNQVLEKIRDEGINRNQLLFWDQLLIKAGTYLSTKREEYIDYINGSPKPFGEFKLTYDPSVISEARLTQYKDAEVAAAVTLVGPHRDDFIFLEHERDLAKFGSRGEQRLIVLWTKLAELEYMEKTTDRRPLLLLDDIFSELDHAHREEILKVVHKQQTFITTADRHFLPESLTRQADVVELG